MLSNEEHNLYSRHLLLDEVGEDGQLKLKNSKVLVIGAGGLGCPVLQYISAAGVGTIGIVDFDSVDKSNLQRQVLFSYDSIGKNKALEAKKRLAECNPFIEIIPFTNGIDATNALQIIEGFDIIVDCTDNYSTRFLINDACVLLNKPLVYSAIYKFEGQVSVFNYKNGPTYRCLHPETPKTASITNCSESGVLGVLPGILGTLQANEILKLILKIGDPLSGKIFIYNSLTNSSNIFKLQKTSPEIYTKIALSGKLSEKEYQINCTSALEVKEIDQAEFRLAISEKTQILDVRNSSELPYANHINALNIPLDELEVRYSEIDIAKETIVFCQSGVRSKKAIALLNELTNINHISSLRGGIESYLKSESTLENL